MIPKFRAWSLEAKIMLPVCMIDFEDKFLQAIYDYDEGDSCIDEFNFDEVILMQSTGLKLKDEIEAFDGDIISVPREDGSIDIGYIVWDEYRLQWLVCFKSDSDFPNYHIPLYRCIRVDEGMCILNEVKGNIHEHPHLIQGDNDD